MAKSESQIPQSGSPLTKSRCGCCALSRRCFLSSMTTLAAGASLGLFRGYATEVARNLSDPINLGSFRLRPVVNIKSVVVRRPPPYWLGWPGTAYDLEGFRKHYAEQFAQTAREVGVVLDSVNPPLESEEATGKFADSVKAQKPHGVLVTLQHLGVWPWVARIAEAGVPTIVFAPVGTAFTGQVNSLARREGVYVISSLDTTAMEQALRMIRAKRQFEHTRLLVVAGNQRRESVLERLGTKVRHVPRPALHKLFAQVPESEEAHAVAKEMFRGAERVVEPTPLDGLNAARSFIAAKHLLKAEESNAITSDCLGMVTQRTMPTPPCLAASIFQDTGVTYGCEADINGALSLMLTRYLFDKPGFMNDPVPETYKNLLIAAHCVSGTRLHGFAKERERYILRSHSESDLGVSVQVLWRVGQPVTLVRFQNPNELILDTGTVVGNVDTPPAGGCRTSVEIKMDRIEDCRDVRGFHQVVFYGNHRRDVQAFCQLYGIKVIHSPRYSETA